jgi:hypothetical protein
MLLALLLQIEWKTDYAAALKESAAGGKAVVVHFWGAG